MTKARFIQIHTLTSYAASLLNRDDAGFSKRMPFGGAVRTRVSSQCLKRHWRVFDGEHSLRSIEAPMSVRSRVTFQRHIVEPLVEQGMPLEVVRSVTEALVAKTLGSEKKEEKAQQQQGKKKEKKEKKEKKSETGNSVAEPVATAQVTVLGEPELRYLKSIVEQCCTGAESVEDARAALDSRFKDEKELKKNIRALMAGSLEAGLGAALFGRMVTGDVLARIDAAVHVAHAMTVHGQFTESDYFSALDEILGEDGDQESGHINASELTSGLFYGYVVIDVPGLLRNLGDDFGLAGDVVERLVHMIATVSPGAKRGATAPYAYSHLVMVEAGRAQPRTFANAFLDPVATRGNVIENAYKSLASHISDLDAMYGTDAQVRTHAGLRTGELFGTPSKPLAEIAQWARGQVTA